MSTLTELQGLLTELFTQTSSPERLSYVQELLSQFEREPTAWKSALSFLSMSTDQYVCMFSLGVIETALNRLQEVSQAEKQTILSFLEDFALVEFVSSSSSSASPPTFTKFKAVKLAATIYKRDFIHNLPSFTEKLLRPLTVPANLTSLDQVQRLSFALTLLHFAYGELIRPDASLNNEKAAALRSELDNTARSIFNAVIDLTETLLCCDILNKVKGLFTEECVSEAAFYASTREVLGFSATLLCSADLKKQELSPRLVKVFVSILLCLSDLVAAAPLSSLNPYKLYSCIYVFGILGSPTTLTTISNLAKVYNLSSIMSLDVISDVGFNSLSCLQEVVERKDIPRDSMVVHLSFVFKIIHWYLLMQDPNFPVSDLAEPTLVSLSAAKGTVSCSAPDGVSLTEITLLNQTIESIWQNTCQKLSDLLQHLVTNFLNFFKQNEQPASASPYQFHPLNFMLLVHNFTFQTCKRIFPVYISSLNTWASYLEFTRAIYYGDSATPFTITQRNVDLPQSTQLIISTLCLSLTSSLYFSDSASFLDSLDNESDDLATDAGIHSNSYSSFFDDILQNTHSPGLDRHDSEYHDFVQTSLTLLSSVTFFVPKLVFQSIFSHLQEGLNVFRQLTNPEEQLVFEEHVSRKLHGALRDLTMSLQCLSFLADNLVSLDETDMLRWLLPYLVQSLGAGVSFLERITALREETIRKDVIQVVIENVNVIRCLIASGFVISSEDGLPVDRETKGCLVLSVSERDSLVALLLSCIRQLLFTTNSPWASNLPLHAAELFFNMVTTSNPPGFLPSSGLLLSPSSNPESSGHLQDILGCCFSVNTLKSLPIAVQRVIVRACTIYLLTDEVPRAAQLVAPKRLEDLRSVTSLKLSLFTDRLFLVFSQCIQPQTLKTDEDSYFAGLCWLNEAVASLSNLSGKSRRLMYDQLLNSKLLDQLWPCLDASLTASVDSERNTALFIAHLSFFVQFIDVYGNQKATASLIPGFVTGVLKLLQVLEQKMSSRLVSPVMAHLVRLLNVLVQNRSAFLPLVSEIFHFCVYFLLLNLASVQPTIDMTVMANVTAVVSRACLNDADFCVSIFTLVFRIVSFGFHQLTQHNGLQSTPVMNDGARKEDDFNLFMRLVVAVFSENVTDLRLVVQTIDSLCSLNQHHDLFALPIFTTRWRDQLGQCILCFLMAQPQTDGKESLFHGLYSLYVATNRDQSVFQANLFWESALLPFLVNFQHLLPSGKSELYRNLALSFNSPGSKFKNVDELSSILSPFLIDLKYLCKSGGTPFSQAYSLPIKVT
ncbi:unnamed protein product [Schistocephalus solidus]|uniref:Exportin-6 n=2 Tax=Schistocephalus solidus TaxID=70667 RepID=A0A183SIN7_SCHSO|nr:unnamed protein product [Schistocephalus solidus]